MKNKNGIYPCFFPQDTGMKVNIELNFFKENYIYKSSADIVGKKKLLMLIKTISPFPTMILVSILLQKINRVYIPQKRAISPFSTQCFLLNQIILSPFDHIFDIISVIPAEFEKA